MTREEREEAIAYGEDYLKELMSFAACDISERHMNFVKMSIAALKAEPFDPLKLDGMLEDAYEHGYVQARHDFETQPCEDAVSRNAVISLAKDIVIGDYRHRCIDPQSVMELPPVTPKQRTGKWIDDKCSVCGKGIEDLISSPEWYRNEEPKFCPYCGVKLEGENE